MVKLNLVIKLKLKKKEIEQTEQISSKIEDNTCCLINVPTCDSVVPATKIYHLIVSGRRVTTDLNTTRLLCSSSWTCYGALFAGLITSTLLQYTM